MKCEKCGNEANFFYSSTVNGQHEEHCYCADCAKAEGFEHAFDFRPMLGGMFDDFFGGDFFSMPRRMLSAFDSFGDPFGGMIGTRLLPRPGFGTALPQTQRQENRTLSEAEAKVPEDAGAEVRSRREREALRAQLDEAVKAEDFEKCIQLRDKLKELEG